MSRLEGKVAVITGAASGIGREAALLFSAEGARVCVADVDAEAGERTASECADGFFQRVDVTDSGLVTPTIIAAQNPGSSSSAMPVSGHLHIGEPIRFETMA